ncbi:hypothetical protein ACLI4Z_17495 [Natrialbaceae archaeon A-arb3/5]
MSCPFLEYRNDGDGHRFDEPRAYCTAADRFVQPMRADICTGRYDLAHDRHCEIYREHAPDEETGATEADAGNGTDP